MRSSVKLVSIGHILNEKIVFADGRKEPSVLGGPAAYFSVVSARLGISTGIVTKVGTDALAGLLQPFKEAGVDLEGVFSKGDSTTTNELIYASDESKELKYLKHAPPIVFKDIPDDYHQAQAFYICPVNYEISVKTVSEIARLGKIMGVDLGGYGGAHVCKKRYAEDKMNLTKLEELVSLFQIAKASDEDCSLLFSEENLSEEESAQRLVDWGADIAIITMGVKGSLVFTRNKRYHVPSLSGKVMDVTGGGDSYMAGFLAEFIQTGDPLKSAVFASAVALCVIEATGGVRALRMPTLEEARKRVSQGISPIAEDIVHSSLKVAEKKI